MDDASGTRVSPGAGSAPQGASRTLIRLLSGDFFGMEGRPVEVQVDVASRASPEFIIVGLVGKSIRESRERIRTAIRNSGLRYPHLDRILVNLAPAAQEKEGSGFDLPIAMGILLASGQVHPGDTRLSGRGFIEETGFLGELGLNGELRPVRGALLTAHSLRRRGARRIVIARGNGPEAALIDGLEVFAAQDLHQAIAALEGRLPAFTARDAGALDAPTRDGACAQDFADVKGQEATKRGLLIAAAGGHNALLVGPPGVGKTLLARRIPGILPPMESAEALEVTRIASVTGQEIRGRLATARPFRSPHHTISYAGLVGGGSRVLPGEVTRAHRGVLFLDELPEFHRKALEALREPLEEGRITIGRSAGSVTFPSRFLLVAAMNPCPCGYLGHPRRRCSCSPHEARSYRQRISGPLLDRIDLFLDVAPVDPADLIGAGGEGREGTRPGLTTPALAASVRAARSIQARRWGRGIANGEVSLSRLLAAGDVGRDALALLQRAAERLGLSARGFGRCLRVARTIADLEGARDVSAKHLGEAIQYREAAEM